MGDAVFVTGISGFVGGWLAKALVDKGYKVVGLMRDVSHDKSLQKLGIADKVTLVQGDILDQEVLERVLAEYKPKYVCHLAAQAIVSAALKIPAETFSINCVGTACLLEACRKVHMPKGILIFSTDKVYGEGMDKKESDTVSVTGIYETSKAVEEMIALSFMKSYDMPIVISRACNIYGAFDDNSRIVPNTMSAIAMGFMPVVFSGDESLREYIYVEDVCDAVIMLLENIEKTKGEVFNIGTGDIVNQKDLVMMICGVAGWKGGVDSRVKPVMPEIWKQSLDSGKIKVMFSWSPKYSLDVGLNMTWDIEFAKGGEKHAV